MEGANKFITNIPPEQPPKKISRKEFLGKMALGVAGISLIGAETSDHNSDDLLDNFPIKEQSEKISHFRDETFDYSEIQKNKDLSVDLNIRILEHVASGNMPEIIYFAPHPDEDASHGGISESVQETVGTAGIIFENRNEDSVHKRYIKFKHNDYYPEDKPHEIYVDPNRIFTDQGIYETLTTMNFSLPEDIHDSIVSEIIYLRDCLVDMMKIQAEDEAQPKLVMALHTNTEGNYDIDSYQSAAKADSVEISKKPNQDPDYFYLTNARHLYTKLDVGPYSVVFDKKPDNDGSLSYYCLQQGVPYVNVETLDGDKKMMEDMMTFVQEVSR